MAMNLIREYFSVPYFLGLIANWRCSWAQIKRDGTEIRLA